MYRLPWNRFSVQSPTAASECRRHVDCETRRAKGARNWLETYRRHAYVSEISHLANECVPTKRIVTVSLEDFTILGFSLTISYKIFFQAYATTRLRNWESTYSRAIQQWKKLVNQLRGSTLCAKMLLTISKH